MTKVKLIKMKRMTPNPPENLTEIEVHPDTVANHIATGWFVAPVEPEPEPEEVVEEKKSKK